ncbi:Lysine-specific demethylase 7A [Porphyridium purpureum]|uniref:Lysine-specific demethylase 7A n=1 Tax=Porphyridium purpureum TaxID=35688 RepID=A0A5J4Z0S0_PORPP|nr:Lysine-specific demethylase 7A [Porphyridium purpureum]|eukprot:POR9362..scf208_2
MNSDASRSSGPGSSALAHDALRREPGFRPDLAGGRKAAGQGYSQPLQVRQQDKVVGSVLRTVFETDGFVSPRHPVSTKAEPGMMTVDCSDTAKEVASVADGDEDAPETSERSPLAILQAVASAEYENEQQHMGFEGKSREPMSRKFRLDSNMPYEMAIPLKPFHALQDEHVPFLDALVVKENFNDVPTMSVKVEQDRNAVRSREKAKRYRSFVRQKDQPQHLIHDGEEVFSGPDELRVSPTKDSLDMYHGEQQDRKKKHHFEQDMNQNPEPVYCVCKQPWKGSEFMIGCDGKSCSRWFHPGCITIMGDLKALARTSGGTKFFCNECDSDGVYRIVETVSKGKEDALVTSGAESDKKRKQVQQHGLAAKKATRPLYCVCQKPWRNDRFMIGCEAENCDRWFHPKCIGLGGVDLQSSGGHVFVCDSCDPSGRFQVYRSREEAEVKQAECLSQKEVFANMSAITKSSDKSDDKHQVGGRGEVAATYCVCESPYDAKRFMIGCEATGCDKWFHPECISVSLRLAKHPRAVFFCQWCDPNAEYSVIIPTLKPATASKSKGSRGTTEDESDVGLGAETKSDAGDFRRHADKSVQDDEAADDLAGPRSSAISNLSETALDATSVPQEPKPDSKNSSEKDLSAVAHEHGDGFSRIAYLHETSAAGAAIMETMKASDYCVCKQGTSGAHPEGQDVMIGCESESCNRWFHPACINISLEDATHPKARFICDRCDPSHEFNHVLPRARRKNRVDYMSLNDGHYSEKNSLPLRGTVAFRNMLSKYEFTSDPFVRLRGHELNVEFAEASEMKEPIVIPDVEGLDMLLPEPGSVSADMIGEAVGRSRRLDVIDVQTQSEILPQWTLGQFIDYFNSPPGKRTKVLNVISLEVSHTSLAEKIRAPKFVYEIGWVERCWPKQAILNNLSVYRDHPFTRIQYPKVQLYSLMSAGDTFTDFHVDFGGSSVWYHLFKGRKIFYFIRPTPENLAKYETWANSPTQNSVFFADEVDTCYQVCLQAGNTMIIPSGWIHAVFTPEDSIVFGGNFLHTFNADMQLSVFEIERRSHVPQRYQFPFYAELHLHAIVAYRNRLLRLHHFDDKLGVNERKCLQKLCSETESMVKNGWFKISEQLLSSLGQATSDLKSVFAKW